MNSEPLQDWQIELMPYFEVAFVYGFAFCESCTKSVSFKSEYSKFSDGWWFDEAKAMKKQGWVVPETQSAFCANCAKKQNIKHNPRAYDFSSL